MQSLNNSGIFKGRLILGLIGFLVLLVILGVASAGPYADYIWFKEEANYTRLFSISYSVRGYILLFSFFIGWAIIYHGMKPVRGINAIYSDEPSPGLKQIAMTLSFLTGYGDEVLRVVPPLLSLLLAFGMANDWKDLLLFTHAQPFHQSDPIFGFDFSFYVFRIQWLNDIVGQLMVFVFVGVAVALVLRFGLKAFASPLKAQIAWTKRPEWSIWAGIYFIITSIGQVLSSFQLLSKQGALFVGPGYSGVVELQATLGLAGLLFLVGVFLILFGRRVTSPKVLISCVAAPIVWAILFVGVLPEFIQRVKVEPDKINAEHTFAIRALTATKFGYNLNTVEVRHQDVTDEPSLTELADSSSTFANMRLWDPSVLRSVLQATQSLRPYYTFNDVDVDRYFLNTGKGNAPEERLVMLASRNINVDGLTGSAQTWVNTKLGYTHGYGVVASQVNEADSMGQPSFLSKNIPVQSVPELTTKQPRLYYFDHVPGSGVDPNDYAVVDTNVKEIDYPTQQGSATNQWSGTHGIALNSYFRRLLFGAILGDGNLIISANITSDSKLLLHRDIIDRAGKLFPFLKFDHDPYVAVVNGELKWILDGYTTSDNLPYSQKTLFGSQSINYIRNSVKVVIDANSGETTGYAIDPNDPILATYRSIFPGLVKDGSEVPAGIRAHFRYPEDLFQDQSLILCTYHVNDPVTFLDNSDAWDIANERNLAGDRAPIQPYFVLMRLPDEKKDEFLLIRPFTPLARDNMTGWLAAHCDGDRYGELTLYQFPKGSQVLGPAQEENLFIQDKSIAEINRNLNNEQSSIIVGNLLVIPIGKSIIYVEPLFLQSKTEGTQAIPELRKVILATKNRIVVGDSYAEARTKLFGAAGPLPNSVPATGTLVPISPGGKSTGSVSRTAVANVLQTLKSADDALKSGNFGKYGDLQKAAREQLRNLLGSK